MSISGESKRQIEHFIPIFFAFTLKFLTFWIAVGCALAALAWGIWGSKTFNRAGVRSGEAAQGYSIGKISYALVVLALILIFWNDLHVVVGGWTMLSVGDAMSNLAGRAWGKAKLPWDNNKSWAGLAAYAVSSLIFSFILIWWTAPAVDGLLFTLPYLALVCLIASSLAALTETLPLKIDDNISAPAVGALVFYFML